LRFPLENGCERDLVRAVYAGRGANAEANVDDIDPFIPSKHDCGVKETRKKESADNSFIDMIDLDGLENIFRRDWYLVEKPWSSC